MTDIKIRHACPNVLYISSSPSLKSTICGLGLCAVSLLFFLQCEECTLASVAFTAALLGAGLSELGEWEDVITDRSSGQLVMCHRSWHERLMSHTCRTSVTPLTQVSGVCLMTAGRGWRGVCLAPCLRLRTGGATPLFRRSFPPGRQAELRALIDQLTTFLGLARLQSVEGEPTDWELELEPELEPEPVTTLESQSKAIRLLLADKACTEP
ncbi:uncharacterized protein LOC119114222 [Pollicipes pollicipes]|uniref:uncharacterized protein LOC119114222 n=1 Tax=Pollicipes pollicipes TaxID=41117 RepID=UPI001885A144|nr:uncharacterized protein LOC119114222 [Pollicipes pollicipes]XP_037094315.1 uncharacterized protein LOC119114222 [Pollicipes pollicipes]XP_037094316.1 uncharacterized protein LOC119114222 [Pollicipes pollicipes]